MKTDIHQEFPEAKGKIVDRVELTVESDFYSITVRFEDKTALSFVIDPCVVALPIYEDWTSGEGKTLREYAPVRSRLSFETEDETEARLKSS